MSHRNTNPRRASGLRRKAYTLHRRADALLAARKVWEATTARTRAIALEAKADAMEDASDEYASDLAAGFRDDDLDGVFATTAHPSSWTR